MRTRRALILLPLCLLPACANHIRYVDAESEKRDTTPKSTSYVIESNSPEVETDIVKLDVMKVSVTDESSARSTTKYEEYTPYDGTREIWEVPVGIVCMPLALLLNLGDILTFGMIPNETVDGFTAWTFAAANPFMNPEDPERVEKRPVETIVKEGETKEHREETPLANVNVAVHFDDNDGPIMKTDSKGALGFSVLDVITESLQTRPRKLIVSTPDPAGGSEVIQREMYIDRDLAARIYEARTHVLAYKNGPHDPATMGEAVAVIDQLKFKDYSLTMEDKITQEFGGDEQFMVGFRSKLDQYYAVQPKTPDSKASKTVTTENPRAKRASSSEKAAE